MLEAYSKSVTIPANSSAPFTNVSLTKGDTSEMQGDATILFNKCGVYRVSFNASVIASAAGKFLSSYSRIQYCRLRQRYLKQLLTLQVFMR